MYEDRNLAQAERAAGRIDAASFDQGTDAGQVNAGNLGTMVLKNLLVWGSAAISCGIIYLMVTLFV
ncbi:MAG: hypothetical protein AAFN63_14085 [Pseudomonadota bacterium]